VGDYFHQVTVGVIEMDAATAVQVIDLAELCAPRISVIPDALSADLGERRVEFRVRRGKWSNVAWRDPRSTSSICAVAG
jgi:hypothetical protein